MAIHELKTEKMFFEEVFKGTKKFELRKNDRNFKIGDELWLREIVTVDRERETGRLIAVNVIGILHGPIFGLKEGWCIMSIEES